MRAVIQRVKRASVTIAGDVVGKIDAGYLILLGVGHADTRAEADKLWGKIFALRINDDEEGKTNLSLPDVDGEVLVVSQFTLFANCRKGRRPSFVEAAPPAQATELYEYFVDLVRADVGRVQTGRFGADMQVELVNDGPFNHRPRHRRALARITSRHPNRCGGCSLSPMAASEIAYGILPVRGPQLEEVHRRFSKRHRQSFAGCGQSALGIGNPHPRA